MEYSLRGIKAPDVFTMTALIGKLGIANVSDKIPPKLREDAAFTPPMTIINGKESPLARQYWTEAAIRAEQKKTAADLQISIIVTDLLFQNFAKTENEVYKLLASGTGKTVTDIAEMSGTEFLQLVDAYITREEFGDFFTEALRLASDLGKKRGLLTASGSDTETQTESLKTD